MSDDISSAPLVGSNAPATTEARQQPEGNIGCAPIKSLDDKNNIPGNKFAFSPSILRQLVENRNPESLRAFGGLSGLAVGLRTDVDAGLGQDEDVLYGAITISEAVGDFKVMGRRTKSDEPVETAATPSSIGKFTDRRSIYGENRVPKRKPITFLHLLWLAFNDKLMFLLTASAIVSLALGIYQSVASTEGGSSIEWVEGVAILVAVAVIVLATAINDYQKNHKFQKLNQKKEERKVTVIRSGKHQSISIFDILVGDILRIETGDIAPADGILVQGFDIQCDESALTGESKLVAKAPVPEVNTPAKDPFIIGGSRATTGVGTYLVLATGINSSYGRIMMSLQEDVRETPLQQKLGVLAKYIIAFGLAAGAVFFTITFIRFLVSLKDFQGGAKEKGHAFLEVLILSITIVVIAVPEGLPLTVTLALAFATTRMLKDNNLVRLLRSCEIMGNATTVCSDKTGTLTQNKMSVVRGILGSTCHFLSGPISHESDDRRNIPSAASLFASLPTSTKDFLKSSFVLNSTAIETTESSNFVGSSTETALLKFALDHLGMRSLSEERANGNIVQIVPFDSKRKWMAVVAKLGQGRHRLFVKGAAEVVLAGCHSILRNPAIGMETDDLSPETMQSLKETIVTYAQESLRVVSVAYRDFEAWPPAQEIGTTSLSDLVFTGAFGIRDPLRPEVVESVRQCQSAGVFVRMVTGDSFSTGVSIASECGIYTPGGIAMDGPIFRKLSPAQLDHVIPRLQVLTRSSPDDKMRLVTHLKSLDEIVAVTGDGTNDALALKAADVGFSMGISGTEVAKEASAIVLMDDDFASIAKAISWGRAVNDAAKKFLQFQFTINVTAGALTIMSVLIGGTDSSVFSIVQLLWINLIMDTFAALALGTDFPTPDLLRRKPEPRGVSVVNITMWKMIVGQSMYQLAVIFTLHYAGEFIFQYHTEHQLKQLQTMTFNTYVWMQFFNQINSRRVDNRFNVLEGVQKNLWFIAVQALTLAGQVIIVIFGGDAFQVVPLTGGQWGRSLLLGSLTIPLGMLLRLIPDWFLSKTWAGMNSRCSEVFRRLYRQCPGRNVTDTTSSRFRNAFNFFNRKDLDNSMVAAVEATHVNLQLQQPQVGLEDTSNEEIDLQGAIEAAKFGLIGSSTGIQVHPDTRKDDPVLFNLRGMGIPPSQNPVLYQYMQPFH